MTLIQGPDLIDLLGKTTLDIPCPFCVDLEYSSTFTIRQGSTVEEGVKVPTFYLFANEAHKDCGKRALCAIKQVDTTSWDKGAWVCLPNHWTSQQLGPKHSIKEE